MVTEHKEILSRAKGDYILANVNDDEYALEFTNGTDKYQMGDTIYFKIHWYDDGEIIKAKISFVGTFVIYAKEVK